MHSVKIDKDFVLSDSSQNVYGFKLLTDGYLIDEYLKNPIGYYGHKKDDGPLVKWYDVRLDGDSIIGKPEVNLLHPRGQRTVDEVNSGFLKCASMGKLTVLDYELEDNPEDPENPTMVATKWYNKETSLVDNPGNRNAMAVELEDGDGNELNLADITEVFKKQKNSMKTVQLKITPALIGLLGLADNGEITAEVVEQGIKDLHGENTRLETEVTTVTAAKEKAEQDLADEKTKQNAARIKATLDKGLKAGKFTKETRDKLEKTYAAMPDDLEDLVEGMPAFQSVTNGLKTEDNDDSRLGQLKKKVWKDLDDSGELEELKGLSEEAFKAKLAEFKASKRKK